MNKLESMWSAVKNLDGLRREMAETSPHLMILSDWEYFVRTFRQYQVDLEIAVNNLKEATMSKANIWDGVGPERECLLRVRWNNSDDAEWIQFDFQSADGEYTEDGLVGNRDRYRNESATLYVTDVVDYGPNRYESEDFVVTHWAEIPEVIP